MTAAIAVVVGERRKPVAERMGLHYTTVDTLSRLEQKMFGLMFGLNRTGDFRLFQSGRRSLILFAVLREGNKSKRALHSFLCSVATMSASTLVKSAA